MQLSESTNQKLHEKLPIDDNEKIIDIYKHHWFAYASSWIITGLVVIVIIAVAVLLTGSDSSSLSQYRAVVVAGACLFGLLVLLGGLIPVYLRSQEQIVLTEEAVLQVLQPSLFSSKVDQLGLQRIDDVAVHQDFFGTILGYGKLTIETPGEQDNYEFAMVPKPQQVARAITAAHENFTAALQSGRLETTLGAKPQAQAPAIDPEEFQQFLEFQRMQKMQQNQQTGGQPAAQPQNDQNGEQQQSSEQSQRNDQN